jgi:hypothetical protein
MSKENRQQAEQFIRWLREHVSVLYTEESIDKLADQLDVVWGQGYDDCALGQSLRTIIDKSS